MVLKGPQTFAEHATTVIGLICRIRQDQAVALPGTQLATPKPKAPQNLSSKSLMQRGYRVRAIARTEQKGKEVFGDKLARGLQVCCQGCTAFLGELDKTLRRHSADIWSVAIGYDV